MKKEKFKAIILALRPLNSAYKKIFKIVIKKIMGLVLFLLVLSMLLLALPSLAEEEKENVVIQFFYGHGCPHCAKEEIFLNKLVEKYPWLEIQKYEAWYNESNRKLLAAKAKEVGIDRLVVPITFIGNSYVVGYKDDFTTGKEIENLVLRCYEQGCVQEQSFNIPFFGSINPQKFSLPLITAVLGLTDGFNPCAMWVLLTLLALLIVAGSFRKILLVGGFFIFVSAAIYFIFIAAWLNIFLYIGYIHFLRYVVGAGALTAGILLAKQFFVYRPVCPAPTPRKKKIEHRMKAALAKASLPAMLFSIAIVAITVNSIEIVCSLGLPVLFTSILSMANLPTLAYYGYIGLYSFFYMLDDLIIFGIAAATFSLALGHGYGRWLKLLSAILLVALGILLFAKPEWLFLS